MGLFLPTNLVFVKELVAPIPVTCGRFLYIPVTVDFLLHTFQWQGSHAEGTFSPVTCFFYLSSAFKQSYELMKFGWIPRAAELGKKKKVQYLLLRVIKSTLGIPYLLSLWPTGQKNYK